MFGGGNLFSTQQKLCKIHVSRDSVIELSHKENDFFSLPPGTGERQSLLLQFTIN